MADLRFCGKCRYYHEYMFYSLGGGLAPPTCSLTGLVDCRHPNNKRIITTYLKQEETTAWCPKIKNQNNDCEHYLDKEPEREKSWWRKLLDMEIL